MFRIRRVMDDIYPLNQRAVKQVMEIVRSRFAAVREEKVQALAEQLRNPLKYQFRSILFVADNYNGHIMGFAMLQHAPDLHFCFLDYLATAKNNVPSGIGGALYERCREEARLLNSLGIFMECLPDDSILCPGDTLQQENASRLKFYERYGARPILKTLYETPVNSGDTCPPYLVYDGLDRGVFPSAKEARMVVNAILRRKYGDYCPEDYIRRVVHSFQDDPIVLREYRYVNPLGGKTANASWNNGQHENQSMPPVYLTVNDQHQIHHVREVGYVESPVRIASILKHLQKSGLFQDIPVAVFPEKYIRQVHANELVDFIKNASEAFPQGTSVYPYIFPVRNAGRKPKDINVLAGYYCIDTFTPIHHNVWKAAKGAVDCALSAASKVVETSGLAYALVRPPGHHAESKVFGGFCYLNAAAIAAHYLSLLGRVAILDIDYHHGNGQQEIFYQRQDVLTISLHGHPSATYPYFCGYRNERGEGAGAGFNMNYPFDPGTDAQSYRLMLADALKQIERFKPRFLVVCLGLDTAKGDPTGSLMFSPRDFEKNARMIGSLNIPTLVVQEGGYLNRTLGSNVLSFFKGLHETFYKYAVHHKQANGHKSNPNRSMSKPGNL